MGGGDLNMKKSWHPLLLKNQERVWLEEKKAAAGITQHQAASERAARDPDRARRRLYFRTAGRAVLNMIKMWRRQVTVVTIFSAQVMIA